MQVNQFFLNGDMHGAIAYMPNSRTFSLPTWRFLNIVNIEPMKYRTSSTRSCVCIRFIFMIPFIAD